MLVAGLAGCAIRDGSGGVGISVDAKGDLSITIAWCGDQPDGVAVYRGSGENETTAISLLAPKLSGPSATVNIQHPEDGWQFEKPPLKLEPNIEYHVYAWDRENEDHFIATALRLDVAARLKPNLVLVQRYNESESRYEDAFLSPSQFTAWAQGDEC